MYSFLQHTSGASGDLILGTLLFLLMAVMNLKAHYEKVRPLWRLLLAGAMLVTLAIPYCGAIELRDEIASKSLTVKQAYIVERKGDLIQFKRSLSNAVLKQQVTVHILSETKNQYQVEYEGQYYQINKSDVHHQ